MTEHYEFTEPDRPLPSTEPAPQKRTAYKFRYICKSKCKNLALEIASQVKTKKYTRVGEEFLIACEANLKQFILSRVKGNTTGKTLK